MTSIMKSTYKYIIIAIFSMVLTSCFKDLGNYDYHYYADFEVEELEKNYNVTSFVENLKITPVIKSELKDFEYVWFITTEKQGMHRVEEYADTLSTDPVLDMPFRYPTGEYELYLKVISKDSGDAKYVKTTINAVTPFMNGWYILLETADGNTEMDIHYLDGVITRNAIKEFNGDALKGSPKFLSYLPEMSYLDEENGINIRNYVMVTASEDEMATFNMTDMSVARTSDQWFYDEYDISNIHHIASFGYSVNIFASTGVHTNYQMPTMPSAGKFSKDSDLAGGLTPSVASDVCYFGDVAFFYDGANKRFVEINYNKVMREYPLQYAPQTPGSLPTPETIEGKIIFMGGISPSGVSSYKFLEYIMIICEKEDGSRNWFYVKPDGTSMNIVKKGTFEAGSPFASASHYTSSKNGANYLYAAHDGHIYAMNPDNGNVQELTFQSLPAGEITYFQTMFNITSDSGSPYYLNSFLIGTAEGGSYTVSQYDMIGGIPVLNQGPVKTFSGEGKVKTIQFANQTKRSGVMNISNSLFSIHY